MVGVVKKIVADRGFGFIRTDTGQDVFFHRSQLEAGTDMDDLQEGATVAFELRADSPKGPRAVDVALVEAAVR
jgi:cold shock protein